MSADYEVLTALIQPDSYLSDSSANLAKQFGRFLVATRLERLERNGTLQQDVTAGDCIRRGIPLQETSLSKDNTKRTVQYLAPGAGDRSP